MQENKGPEWQLETNAKHYESAAIDAGKNAQRQQELAEEYRVLAENFRAALKKLQDR